MSDTTGGPFDGAPLQPDVVHPEPGGQVVPFASRAIDRAAEAALTEPGIPGRAEFLSMAAMARMISLSPLAPKHLRGEPYSAFMVLLTARDLGISVTYAISKIVPIEGKPSIPPELQRALVRRRSLGDIEPAETNDTQAVPMSASARAVYPDRRVGPWATFTWQDAQIAELVDADCQAPLAHVTAEGVELRGHAVKDCSAPQKGGGTRRWKGCYCKDNWRKYPRRMLWQRVQGYVTRDHFPEATLGLYTADELGALTDEDGHAIDVSSVELPPDYVDPVADQRERAGQQQAAQAERERIADWDALWDLQVRIRALPDGLRAQLGERWRGEQSNLRNVSTRAVPLRLLGNARAMVNAHEAEAKRGGVDLEAAAAVVLGDVVATLLVVAGRITPADELPQGASEPEPGPDSAPEPAETATEPQAPDPGDDSGDGDPANAPADEPPAEPATTDDFREQLANVAKRVRDECEGVPDEVIGEITMAVKGLHHTKVDRELTEAGVPTSGPIDLRRMHLCLLQLRAWKTEQQAGPEAGHEPGDPLPAMPPPVLCEHGEQFGECPTEGCPHVRPF